MAGGISARDGESGGGNIGGVENRLRKLFGERDSDTSRARADVGDYETVTVGFLRAAGAELAQGESIERDFDEVFCFRAWNEDVWSDFKFQAPEFLFAGEMLRWFAIGAASEQRLECVNVRGIHRLFGMGVEPGAIALKDVEQKHFSREGIAGDVRVAETGDASSQCGAYIHGIDLKLCHAIEGDSINILLGTCQLCRAQFLVEPLRFVM